MESILSGRRLMQKVPTKEKKLEGYTGIVSEKLLSEIVQTAKKLEGLRIVHINATPQGGGVAEILKSMVPLMRDVGINAEWYALSPEESFFRISKTLHHCLQGYAQCPTADDLKVYQTYNERAAHALASTGVTADLWFFHDVQVLPMMSYMNSCPGVWICHIDTTKPNEIVRQALFPI
jgi:trehalose synthase